MLKITVQELGDTSVVRCHGRIVAGDDGSILRKAAFSQRHTKMIVIDLARVERIDAGGLGVLLGLRESAGSRAIMFKLMNATRRVEEILELTHLQRVFEFCSVRELFCLLHHDSATNLIYFGYGGQNAGFDAYERVGILQPSLARIRSARRGHDRPNTAPRSSGGNRHGR